MIALKHLTPYFTFDGDGKAALDFYTDVFGGEVVESMTFGDAEFETPPEADDRIMHAYFKKGDMAFMVSDTFPGQSVPKESNVSVVIEPENEDELQRLYDRLMENGTILMELQDTFWGARYALVKDAYGITWNLNYQK
ncbi:VOC family protein [Pseudalkalibacillus sp. R45]|uniref:VOC family protein n=1 Tax=Pseudalkalibacillus sp. R45 TaxID=3457433 RepID=UPI003FCDE7E3